MRAPGSATLKTRVFAVFTRKRRTTSPTAAWSEKWVCPFVSMTFPNRPIAVNVGPSRSNGAIWPCSIRRSSTVIVSWRSAGGQYDGSAGSTTIVP